MQTLSFSFSFLLRANARFQNFPIAFVEGALQKSMLPSFLYWIYRSTNRDQISEKTITRYRIIRAVDETTSTPTAEFVSLIALQINQPSGVYPPLLFSCSFSSRGVIGGPIAVRAVAAEQIVQPTVRSNSPLPPMVSAAHLGSVCK